MALYACRAKGHVEVEVEEEDESCDRSDHMTDGGDWLIENSHGWRGRLISSFRFARLAFKFSG